MGFVGSYIWKLRQALGTQRLIIAGVAMLLVNSQGQIWLGRRRDTGEWCFFGGAMELGDSVMDAVLRETQEELGLVTNPSDWRYVGVHSLPTETNFTYHNGDKVQVVNHIFTAVIDTPPSGGDDEHTEFGLFDLDALPAPLKPDAPHTFEIYKSYLQNGQVQVK